MSVGQQEPFMEPMTTGAPAVDGSGAPLRAGDISLRDLKHKTLRGGLVGTIAQGTKLALRMGSMMLMARLLAPEDFGLVGMVTAVTGVLNIVKDAGLSMVTVQRAEISHEQTSTLFWVNFVIGGGLAAVCVAAAPLLAAFYREPRLFWITVALASGFCFGGASAQHQALLQRQLRFFVLALIDLVAMTVSIAVGILMVWGGCGYWALVATAVVLPAVSAIGAWWAAAWVPGRPRRKIGIRSMLHFGGAITINNFVFCVAHSADKVLLGRFWGAEALGIYGRAYTLANLPRDQLDSAIGWVAFPALSKLQDDPISLRACFLRGYSLVISLTIPIAITFALFSEDIILVLLGPKWRNSATIFRMLAPTVLAFALLNPAGWLLNSVGRVGRSLMMTLLIAPLLVLAFCLGLHYGPIGVAAGYSITMSLLAVPIIAWGVKGTVINALDLLRVLARPLIAGTLAAAAGYGLLMACSGLGSPLARLLMESSLFFGLYAWILLSLLDQKAEYIALLQNVMRSKRRAPGR